MKLHILNESGTLDEYLGSINEAFEKASKIAEEKLDLKTVDVIFRAQPDFAIPELGVGGYTVTDGYTVYISIDSSKHIEAEDFLSTLLHELHHAARFQKVGYEDGLLNNLVQEGLACLFEEETAGKLPIYASLVLEPSDITKATQYLKSNETYDHARWFFGTNDIKRWFGYSYGYKLCKQYTLYNKTDSSHLVDTSASTLIKT